MAAMAPTATPTGDCGAGSPIFGLRRLISARSGFPNWDPYSHNVFSRSRAAQFDLDRYSQGVSKSYTFNSVGMVQLFCNIHPQMRAVLLVVPNRHFTLADDKGHFALNGVPPGEYALVTWHSRAGARRQSVVFDSPSTPGIEVTLSSRPRRTRSPSKRSRRAQGVERGLGLKRERLNLPVVQDSQRVSSPGR